MDAPNADPDQLRRSLAFIRWINATLGYTRATLRHLDRFSRGWNPNRRVTILDVATGSGDVPMAILRWADRRGFNVHVVGLDLHETTVRDAAERNGDNRFNLVRGDATCLPFGNRSFDYVLTGMFLHHLDDDAVVTVLREINRVARRGVIAADLLRARRAYAWVTLFTLLANPMVKHDARVSVAQAFNRQEILALRDRAGWAFTQFFTHFGHRFVLAGEKQ
jgi:ubiquinone/menaquinone biosynthesis C-methylase UbiE